jgi:hypothetical protein
MILSGSWLDSEYTGLMSDPAGYRGDGATVVILCAFISVATLLCGCSALHYRPYSRLSSGFGDRTRHIVALTRNRSFGEREPLNVNADSLMAIYRTAGSAGAAMLAILEEWRAGDD